MGGKGKGKGPPPMVGKGNGKGKCTPPKGKGKGKCPSNSTTIPGSVPEQYPTGDRTLSIIDRARHIDPFWHSVGFSLRKFRVRTEGCYPLEGSAWAAMEPASSQEIKQHVSALSLLFPFRSAASTAANGQPGPKPKPKPKKQGPQTLLGAERSLVVNVGSKAHFRHMQHPMAAEQLVRVIGSGYFAAEWSHANHKLLPSVLGNKFSVALVACGLQLPHDVQLYLAQAYWDTFTGSQLCGIDTLATLDQCQPRDEELSMIESYVDAFSETKLAEAERFMLNVARTRHFLPWLRYLGLRAELEQVAVELSPVFQGHLLACRQLMHSTPLAVLLQLLLASGNCLNHCHASGFETNSLPYAELTRCRCVDANLLHYVVVLAAELLTHGDRKQLRAIIESETTMVTRFHSGELFEVSRRQLGGLHHQLAELEASPVTQNAVPKLEGLTLLRTLAAQYNSADAELLHLRKFFSSTLDAFEILDNVNHFVRALCDCCNSPAAAQVAAHRAAAAGEDLSAGSLRRFNWTVASVDQTVAQGLWQVDALEQLISRDELSATLESDAKALFLLTSKSAKSNPIKSPSRATSPTSRRRVLECDHHVLGIKLASQRLLQKPEQVVEQLETLTEQLSKSQLSVLMEAFPSPADQHTLEQFQAKQAIERWRQTPPSQDPLTKTERFMWAVHSTSQGRERVELLFNLSAIPERQQGIEVQLLSLEHALSAMQHQTQLLSLLRLVKTIVSALNKETIKGFELVSLHNLADTRCAKLSADLLDYVAYAAPRAGIDLELAAHEAAQSVPANGSSIEALQTEIRLHARAIDRSQCIVDRLSQNEQTELISQKVQLATACFETLDRQAQCAIRDAAAIKRMLPGSGSASDIAIALKRFVQHLLIRDVTLITKSLASRVSA